MLYTIEDEPRMMKIREKQLREEGRKEARTEDAKMMIDILLERGFSEAEARAIVEKEFSKHPI